MSKKKPLNGVVPAPLVGVSTRVPYDETADKAWPFLLSCLMPQWQDEKQTRTGGTLTLKPLGSYWIITLRCPDEGLETSVALLTLIDAFDTLERSLGDGSAIWKPTYEAQKKARQKKGG